MITLLVLIYLISAFACWYWIYLAHGPNGIFYNISPEWWDLESGLFLVTVFPLINSIAAICFWGQENPLKK